jgi:hypothetical protein
MTAEEETKRFNFTYSYKQIPSHLLSLRQYSIMNCYLISSPSMLDSLMVWKIEKSHQPKMCYFCAFRLRDCTVGAICAVVVRGGAVRIVVKVIKGILFWVGEVGRSIRSWRFIFENSFKLHILNQNTIIRYDIII